MAAHLSSTGSVARLDGMADSFWRTGTTSASRSARRNFASVRSHGAGVIFWRHDFRKAMPLRRPDILRLEVALPSLHADISACTVIRVMPVAQAAAEIVGDAPTPAEIKPAQINRRSALRAYNKQLEDNAFSIAANRYARHCNVSTLCYESAA